MLTNVIVYAFHPNYHVVVVVTTVVAVEVFIVVVVVDVLGAL